MYDNIMHKKICKTIQSYACPDAYNPPCLLHTAQHYAEPAWYSENDKECIILFKEAPCFFVMVFVQVPKKPMHHVFVSKPGYSFHYKKSNDGNKRINDQVHKNVLNTKKNSNCITNKCTANMLCRRKSSLRKSASNNALMINQLI